MAEQQQQGSWTILAMANPKAWTPDRMELLKTAGIRIESQKGGIRNLTVNSQAQIQLLNQQDWLVLIPFFSMSKPPPPPSSVLQSPKNG